jgi:PadR family transcriptional regulator, regulatory protein PadR
VAGVSINIQFKKGVLELCVLSLLVKRDHYGYEISSALETGIAIADGSVYPLLRRLKDDGLVETYLVEASGGPPRKYYHVTVSGLARYRHLVDEWQAFAGAVANLMEGDNDV